MSETITARQRRTAPARAALAKKLADPGERADFYRLIGQRGNIGRVVLSAEDAAALAAAYQVLAKVAARLPAVAGGDDQ